MTTLIRRFLVPSVLALLVVSAVTAQQTAPPPPPPPPAGAGGGTVAGGAPAPAPTPTPVTAQQALATATRIAGLPERLAALEKIRTDYADSPAPILTQVDTQILRTLLETPQRTTEINAVLDRMITPRTPAAAQPEARFTATATAVSPLIEKKVLLDRAETLLTGSIAALDLEKYVARQVEEAQKANRPAPERAALERTFNQQFRARADYELGRLAAARGDNAKAEALYRSALKIYPQYVAPVTPLAALHESRGEKDKAEAVLKEALKATPTNASAMNALVSFYEREKQPEKSEVLLKDLLKTTPSFFPAMNALVSLYEREKQPAKAEAFLKETLKTTPGNVTAMNALVGIYEREKQPEKAEALLKDTLKTTPSNAAAVSQLVGLYERTSQADKTEPVLLEVLESTPINVTALSALVRIYDRTPESGKTEALVRDVLARDTVVPSAWISLAKIEQKKGDDAKALEAYLQAGGSQYLRGPDLEATKTLYRKVRGTDAGLEAEFDKRYLALPKAVKPAHYTPTSKRTDRLVLLEMFTGSGCPPCVAADLAFDAAMERYGSAVVPLAYHVHIPAPDPMTTTESEARRLFYGVNGVPTFNIDGGLGKLGAGGRVNTVPVYDEYVTKIDKALELASEAAVAARGMVEGDRVNVTVDVTKLPADARDLRLHIVLAERELMFGGENGVRQHPMVVRALAGEKGLGLALAGTGTTQHTFDLAAIRDDITRSLAAVIASRRPAPLAPGATSTFAAEGRAMTAIDPAHLVVVAFVQTADKRVLQATIANVAVGAGTRTGGQAAQQTTPPPPPTGNPTQRVPAPAPAPATPPAPRPEQEALTAANRLTDPAARLTALEKVRLDFPQGINLAQVDQSIFTTLVNNFPARTGEMSTVLDRIMARIPSGAGPELRILQTLTPVNMLVGRKVLLDRSEKLVTDALGGFDFQKFAENERAVASRAARPEPSLAMLESRFNTARARGFEALARIALARGDSTKAEAEFKKAIAASPSLMTAVDGLVTLYKNKGDRATAKQVLESTIKAATSPAAATPARVNLAEMLIEDGELAKAEEHLKEAVKASPASNPALLGLAKLEAKQGNERGALNRFIDVATTGGVKGADHDAMIALYRKVHGNTDGLETEIDTAYRAKFPNPVKPEAWKATAARTTRLVLVEMFTGSACGPCVAADLALDAAMARYGDAMISLAYHVHIPGPDPMTTTDSETRRLFYGVTGVPTAEIDGVMVAGVTGTNLGGGPRDGTKRVYDAYIDRIDKALETPSTANIALSTTAEGETIRVNATVSALPADARDLRLHIVLAERELKFGGENGIRFHPVVVRDVAGENATGLPVSANGTITHSFNLAAIREDIVKSLAADIERRRRTEPPGSAPRVYNAEGRAMTEIDVNHLVVVAYLQGPDKKVLQAAQIDVVSPDARTRAKK